MRETRASTLLSVAALCLSAITVYTTELAGPALTLTAAETAYLARDPSGSAEVVLVPLTISNGGANEGVVHAISLEVEAVGREGTRRFFAAATGPRPSPDAEPFAPLSISGQASTARAVMFYPLGPGEALIDRAGTYRLRIAGQGPHGRQTAELELTLPYFSLPELADGRLIRMTPLEWETRDVPN
ncbi:MAG: hypothetical protein ACFBSD_05290 [Paracoccaceae bacterium]